MAYQKVYARINWENWPSDETPLNEQNLNKVDKATDQLDDRVIHLDTSKFDKSEAQTLIKDFSIDRATGVITLTRYNNTQIIIDTLLEKIAVNFDYDVETQRLIITLDDNTKKYIDLKALITQFEFDGSDTIDFSVDAAGHVTAIVKEGSIEEKHLRPDYLADIKVERAKAEAARDGAEAAEAHAKDSETKAKASETAAAASQTAAAQSASSAATSASTATTQANNASKSASAAAASQTAAATSAANAKTSEDNAKTNATAAATSATNASKSATNSANSATDASNYAKNAKSWAVGGTGSRNGEDTDNSKYYYQQSKNIYDDFTSAGNVTGVKGNAEQTYRTGQVNLTPANIGALAATATAVAATKLAAARNLKVNLAATAAQSFDGTANAENIGVSGVLPVANGGTGQTTVLNYAKQIWNNTGKRINASFASQFRTQTYGSTAQGYYVTPIRQDASNVANSPIYGPGLAFGGGDTHGYLLMNYGSAGFYVGSGNADKLIWTKKVLLDGDITPASIGALASAATAAAATKLAASHNLKVNLATTNAQAFNGTADATNIGVAGVLPIANGGTGNTVGKAAMVAGTYKSGGGAQPPNWIGKGNVKFAMMNGFPGISGLLPTYCDCILMDTYPTGTDVPWATAIAVSRQNPPRAFIASGDDTNATSWTAGLELKTLKMVQGTLAAKATSITLKSSYITTSSLLSFYTSDYKVAPTGATVSAGKVVLTFKAQSAALTVAVTVDN